VAAAGGPSHHFTWSPDSKWLLFDYSIPGIAPGEGGLVRADGTLSTTGKYLENSQTEPDIKVMNEYPVVITGKDQQLEAAVAELMKLIK
jgi:hypothetical protein